MATLREVTEHVDDIKRAREVLGVDKADHPVEVYLALLHIESGGREDLDDQDSYIGPLQIGEAYLQDARDHAKRHYGEDVQAILPDTREGLRSDAYASLVVTMLYMERWRSRHEFNPFRMAAIHKGGIGSAKQITRKLRAGYSLKRSVKWTALHWRYSKTHRRAGRLVIGPSLYTYVYGVDPVTGKRSHRFTQAFREYSAWVENHYGDDPSMPGDEVEMADVIAFVKKVWGIFA